MFQLTDEQQAIQQAALNQESMGINAGAGTGKTSTLLMLIGDMQAQNPSRFINFTVFNAYTRKETEQKLKQKDLLRNTQVKTFNALGYAALKTQLESELDRSIAFSELVVDDNRAGKIKYNDLLKKYFNEAIENNQLMVFKHEDGSYNKEKNKIYRKDLRHALKKMIQMIRVNTTRIDLETGRADNAGELVLYLGIDESGKPRHLPLSGSNPEVKIAAYEQLAQRYACDVYHENDRETFYAILRDILIEGLQMIKRDLRLDFTDQLYYPVLMKAEQKPFDVMMIDEAQDLSPIDRALLQLYIGENTQVIFVGDPQQAIYMFKGADPHSWEMSKRFWNIENEYTLSISFRCPQVVAQLAQQWKVNFRAHADNPTGLYRVIDELDLIEVARRAGADNTTVFLSRTRAELFDYWLTCIQQEPRIDAYIVGNEIAQLKAWFQDIIDNTDHFETARVIDHIYSVTQTQIDNRLANNELADISDLLDKRRTLLLIAEGLKVAEMYSINQLWSEIKQLNVKSDAAVAIMTAHGSKGLEFDVVVDLTPNRYPITELLDKEEHEQEMNLKYVMQTRSKNWLLRLAVTDDLKATYKREQQQLGGLFDESTPVLASAEDDIKSDYEKADEQTQIDDDLMPKVKRMLALLVAQPHKLDQIIALLENDTPDPETTQTIHTDTSQVTIDLDTTATRSKNAVFERDYLLKYQTSFGEEKTLGHMVKTISLDKLQAGEYETSINNQWYFVFYYDKKQETLQRWQLIEQRPTGRIGEEIIAAAPTLQDLRYVLARLVFERVVDGTGESMAQ